MDQCAIVLLGEPVLDQTGEHSSCLYRHDEVHVPGFDLESILFHFVGDGESGFRDVVDTVVGLPCSLGGDCCEVQISVDVSSGFLGTEFEILSHASGDGLQILCEEVALILCVEFGVMPTF